MIKYDDVMKGGTVTMWLTFSFIFVFLLISVSAYEMKQSADKRVDKELASSNESYAKYDLLNQCKTDSKFLSGLQSFGINVEVLDSMDLYDANRTYTTFRNGSLFVRVSEGVDGPLWQIWRDESVR